MLIRFKKSTYFRIMLISLAIGLFCLSCEKDSPTTPSVTTITYTYTPPSTQGTIYTVINKVRSDTVYLSVKWGTWSRASQIDVSNFDGLALSLQHSKDDSVPLTVETDGTFAKEAYQGDAPDEWGNGRYKVLAW